MTREELNAIRERAEKATAGPWERDAGKQRREMAMMVYCETGDGAPHDGIRVADCSCGFLSGQQEFANATFIAHARTDIPALLAEVERLQGAVGEMEGERDAWKQNHQELTARLGWYYNIGITEAERAALAKLRDNGSVSGETWGHLRIAAGKVVTALSTSTPAALGEAEHATA